MSAQHGDKARFHRLRKEKLRRREKMLKTAPSPQKKQSQDTRQQQKAA